MSGSCCLTLSTESKGTLPSRLQTQTTGTLIPDRSDGTNEEGCVRRNDLIESVDPLMAISRAVI